LLNGGTRVEAAKALTKQYAVDPDAATRDVADLVEGLQSAGLVREG
jgi:Coenzyme PQQ synthesis protein D (PqqD)